MCAFGGIARALGAAAVACALISSTHAEPLSYHAGDIFMTEWIGLDGLPEVNWFNPRVGTEQTVAEGGLLEEPTDVAINPAGDLLVADRSGKVIRIDRQTGKQSVFASKGLQAPVGIAVDSLGDVFVADLIRSAIIKIDVTGKTTKLAHVVKPTHITIIPDNRLMVLDNGTHGDDAALDEFNALTGELTNSTHDSTYATARGVAETPYYLSPYVRPILARDSKDHSLVFDGEFDHTFPVSEPMEDLETDLDGSVIALAKTPEARLYRLTTYGHDTIAELIYSGVGEGFGMTVAPFDSSHPTLIPLPPAVWSGAIGLGVAGVVIMRVKHRHA